MAETKVSLNCAYLKGHALTFLFYFISVKKHVWPLSWFLDLSWVAEMCVFFLNILEYAFPAFHCSIVNVLMVSTLSTGSEKALWASEGDLESFQSPNMIVCDLSQNLYLLMPQFPYL